MLFPHLAIDRAVHFANLSEALAEMARFVRHPALRPEDKLGPHADAASQLAGPLPAALYFRTFVAPLADEEEGAGLWEFSPLAAVNADGSAIVAATDVGAYALLGALFHIASGSGQAAGTADSGRGRRCARLRGGDVRPPPSTPILCVAWAQARRGGGKVLDDVWLEAVEDSQDPNAGVQLELTVEALKRREVGGGRDSLLYTTAHAEGAAARAADMDRGASAPHRGRQERHMESWERWDL